MVLAAGLAPALSSVSGWCLCLGLRERNLVPMAGLHLQPRHSERCASACRGSWEKSGSLAGSARPCLGHSEECGYYTTGSIEIWSRGQESNLRQRAYETRRNPIHPDLLKNGRAGGSHTRFPMLPRHGSPQLRPLPDQIAEIKKWHGVSVLPRTRPVLETRLRNLTPSVEKLCSQPDSHRHRLIGIQASLS